MRKILCKSVLATAASLFYMLPISVSAQPSASDNEPALSYSMVSGDQFLLVISGVNIADISDILMDGDSISNAIQNLIKNRSAVFFSNQEGDHFLRIKSSELSTKLMEKQFTVVLSSGKELSYPTKQFNNKRFGNPSVEVNGLVWHCVDNPNFQYPWQDPSYYVRLKNADVSATMGGLYDEDDTSSDGSYHLAYAAGHCQTSFKVTAKHPSTQKYLEAYANVACWGWDSDDTINYYFSNEHTNPDGSDNCGG